MQNAKTKKNSETPRKNSLASGSIVGATSIMSRPIPTTPILSTVHSILECYVSADKSTLRLLYYHTPLILSLSETIPQETYLSRVRDPGKKRVQKAVGKYEIGS